MLSDKKIAPTEDIRGDENTPVDFPWVIYIGVSVLHFTYREVMQMYLGLWTELFEKHKRQHNFIIQKGLYELDETEQEVSSLSAI